MHEGLGCSSQPSLPPPPPKKRGKCVNLLHRIIWVKFSCSSDSFTYKIPFSQVFIILNWRGFLSLRSNRVQTNSKNFKRLTIQILISSKIEMKKKKSTQFMSQISLTLSWFCLGCGWVDLCYDFSCTSTTYYRRKGIFGSHQITITHSLFIMMLHVNGTDAAFNYPITAPPSDALWLI